MNFPILFGCVGSVILLWNRVNYTLGGKEKKLPLFPRNEEKSLIRFHAEGCSADDALS